MRISDWSSDVCSSDLFAPSPGTVTSYHVPGGMHVRVDSGLYQGYRVPPYYDSMIGKLIVYGRTREGCLMRLRRALEEYVIEGVKTTIDRKSVVQGTSGSVRVDLGGHRIIKKKKKSTHQ